MEVMKGKNYSYKVYNEFRKYGNIADFYKSGKKPEVLKSDVMCMLLNGKSLKGE